MGDLKQKVERTQEAAMQPARVKSISEEMKNYFKILKAEPC